METIDSWYRWVIGGLVGITIGFVGWLNGRLDKHERESRQTAIEVAQLQARPYVDPIELMKTLTELTGEIARLTEKVKELIDELDNLRHEVNMELRT